MNQIKILPAATFPITAASINPLMTSLVMLNRLDAGLSEQSQGGLILYLHVMDLFIKSNGAIDYRGDAGLERLKGDAQRFAPSQIVTRHGDLTAAHLAIDYSDTAIRTQQLGLPVPSGDVNKLVFDSREYAGMSTQLQKQIGLLLDWCGKKTIS